MKSWTLWSTHGHQRYLQNKAFHYDEAPQLRHHELKPANNWRPFSSQGGDVISTILRREFTYDQKQGTCAEVRGHQSVFLIDQIHKHLCFTLTEHLCCFSILMLAMPTAQQTPTASRERWTLMATVCFSFSNSQIPQAMLVHSYYITLISTSGTLCYRQKNWQMCSVL